MKCQRCGAEVERIEFAPDESLDSEKARAIGLRVDKLDEPFKRGRTGTLVFARCRNCEALAKVRELDQSPQCEYDQRK